MSCGIGRRRGSDPALLWLWLWLAAEALIQPRAKETPYAMDVTKKKKKKKKKKVSKIVNDLTGNIIYNVECKVSITLEGNIADLACTLCNNQ